MAGKKSLNYLFDPKHKSPPFPEDHKTEYPSEKLTVMICLHPSDIPDANSMNIMIRELSIKNMDLSPSNNNIITISGIPPEPGFDRRKVLEIVQKYFRGAQLLDK